MHPRGRHQSSSPAWRRPPASLETTHMVMTRRQFGLMRRGRVVLEWMELAAECIDTCAGSMCVWSLYRISLHTMRSKANSRTSQIAIVKCPLSAHAGPWVAVGPRAKTKRISTAQSAVTRSRGRGPTPRSTPSLPSLPRALCFFALRTSVVVSCSTIVTHGVHSLPQA